MIDFIKDRSNDEPEIISLGWGSFHLLRSNSITLSCFFFVLIMSLLIRTNWDELVSFLVLLFSYNYL